ncbi:lipoyl synthase [candidate division WOR-3 bacterium]|nr:lipoyl synthase [candidate division WOR-3 bacterium]
MFRRDYLKKPDWLRIKIPSGDGYKSIYKILEDHNLSTVCKEARCPNIGECWAKKSAAIMILGKVCTRACRFCAVATGNPRGVVDRDEPGHVAEVVRALALRYVVITSVDRDDLVDYGSRHYAQTIDRINQSNPSTNVEALIPDFRADAGCLLWIIDARPYVIGHNLETVARLTPYVRDRRCGYAVSLDVLRKCKELNPKSITKSGLMVGLGEQEQEILTALHDLKHAGVDIVTIGQYLQPTRKHVPVQRYYTPDEFARLRKAGQTIGIRYVVSGPLVRSSYHAAEIFDQSPQSRS